MSLPDHILFEDDYILLVSKPAGLMVEPDRNGHPNLLQQVQKYLKGISGQKDVYAQHIHRLDRPVRGIVLFAKQRSVLKNLSEQFAERKVQKHYQALTIQAPEIWQGTLEHWHRKEKKKAQIVSEDTPFAEKVKLDYMISHFHEDKYLWDIKLHTGKFHQIRAQLAHLGCPIIGDQMYGSTVGFAANTIALHACKLEIRHPVDNDLLIFESVQLWK